MQPASGALRYLHPGRTVPEAVERRPVLSASRGETSPEESSAYRPIVVLNEVAKIFKKILVGRLVKHIEHDEPSLSEAQYLFKVGRSTLDVVNTLKNLTMEAVSMG